MRSIFFYKEATKLFIKKQKLRIEIMIIWLIETLELVIVWAVVAPLVLLLTIAAYLFGFVNKGYEWLLKK